MSASYGRVVTFGNISELMQHIMKYKPAFNAEIGLLGWDYLYAPLSVYEAFGLTREEANRVRQVVFSRVKPGKDPRLATTHELRYLRRTLFGEKMFFSGSASDVPEEIQCLLESACRRSQVPCLLFDRDDGNQEVTYAVDGPTLVRHIKSREDLIFDGLVDTEYYGKAPCWRVRGQGAYCDGEGEDYHGFYPGRPDEDVHRYVVLGLTPTEYSQLLDDVALQILTHGGLKPFANTRQAGSYLAGSREAVVDN